MQDIFANDDGCNEDISRIKLDQNNSVAKHNFNDDGDDSHSSDTIKMTFGSREENKSRNSSTMKKIINDTADDEKDNEDVMIKKDRNTEYSLSILTTPI